MDLDRFKEVNDTFGHQFGDTLLKQIAAACRTRSASTTPWRAWAATSSRSSFRSPIDSEYVANTARRVLSTLEQPFVIDGQVLEVGASIGIAVYPTHGTDVRTLLRRADVAMYAAKQAQAGYSFHRDEYESRSPDELGLVVEMRQAIEHDEFELYYQPKLHLRTGLMTRAEVLIRWNHPHRGLLAPGAFIPVAERTGIIRNITDWVFDKALEQTRAWHDAGAPVHLAVNVSAKSLQEQNLPAKIHGLLDKWKVDPRFLKIEITESSIMADPNHALAIMSMLQSLGVRLSVDDFGTGYSSLDASAPAADRRDQDRQVVRDGDDDERRRRRHRPHRHRPRPQPRQAGLRRGRRESGDVVAARRIWAAISRRATSSASRCRPRSSCSGSSTRHGESRAFRRGRNPGYGLTFAGRCSGVSSRLRS